MSVIVVGGGIAGIVSALLIREQFDTVYLIEKEPELGGLLRSFQNEDGLSFDYGSHFLRDTGIEALDRLLYGDFSPEQWQTMGNLKGGGYYGFQYNGDSAFLDTRVLPKKIYHQGIIQLLNACEKPSKTYSNLDEKLRGTFGDTMTDYVFQPILKNKYFGCDLHELVEGSLNFFQLGRIIGLTPQASREIKKSEIYNRKLAFHSTSEGSSDLNNYYPVSGGIGQWIERLKQKLLNMGVHILTENSVDKIHHENNQVNSVILTNGVQLDCNHLIWTIPIFPCLLACDIKSPVQNSPPIRLNTSLYHFVLDRPFLTDVYYIQCHEPTFSTFRITLYPNMQLASTASTYHLTVEVVTRESPNLETMAQKVHRELIQMGIIEPESKLLYQKNELAKGGFPLLTHQFVSDSKTQLAFIKKQLSNATFLGSGGGSHFLMNQVLVDVYEQLTALMHNR